MEVAAFVPRLNAPAIRSDMFANSLRAFSRSKNDHALLPDHHISDLDIQGRGVLAYRPIGSILCNRDLSYSHTQSAGWVLERNSRPHNTAGVHSVGVGAVL